jgi:hypothetical protein
MKGKNLALIFILVITLSILTLPVNANEAVESHEAVKTENEHTEVTPEHSTEHTEEPWWKFTAWEIPFAIIASALFLITTRWLPTIIQNKTEEKEENKE